MLADELGFLFHMMKRSAGGCCQPRNLQRALMQSREASNLKLVDAVDLEVLHYLSSRRIRTDPSPRLRPAREVSPFRTGEHAERKI